MRTFIAATEERYVWNCPYCEELCDDECEDPEEQDEVECEHCGEISKCEFTRR